MTISVVIPVHNSAPTLGRCLAAVCASNYSDFECIVVDDGSTDGSGEIAKSFPVRVVGVAAGPRGAAAARNRGAEAARGDILLFVDADVVVESDTVSKVAAALSQRPDVDAVFGSYDDRPADSKFLSQYKNLTHHFVHQHAREDAATFWGGCGAIRRNAFAAVGGFDEVRYSRSSVEDIELGYRLNASGRKVLLNKQMQVQHLKRWTLTGMIASDLRDRALPWTRLVLDYRTLPNDLNLRVSQRLCTLLMCLLLVYLGTIPFFRPSWPVALPVLGVVLLVLMINHRIFVFFMQKRGVLFALASVPFYLAHYLYSAAAFVVGVTLYVLTPLRAGRRLIPTPSVGSDSDPTASTGIDDLTKRTTR